MCDKINEMIKLSVRCGVFSLNAKKVEPIKTFKQINKDERK